MIFAFVLTLCAKNWKWDDLQPLDEVKTEPPAENRGNAETAETAVKPEEPKPAEEVEKPTEEVEKPTEEAGKPAEEAEKPAEGK